MMLGCIPSLDVLACECSTWQIYIYGRIVTNAELCRSGNSRRRREAANREAS